MRISRQELLPDTAMMRRIVRIGIPGGVDALSIIFCHLAYASVINRLGTQASAAHGLGLQIEAMSYLPGSAFQAAATTMTGQYLGAKDASRARRSVAWACAGAVVVMIAAGIVFATFGEQLAMIFNGMRSDNTTQLVGRLLKIVSLSTPFLAVLMVISGALRGAGDTRWPLAITLVGLLGIRLPLAVILACDPNSAPWLASLGITPFGFGVAGAWSAMVTDVIIRSLWVTWRFIRGDWHKTKV
jgi:putative MATE family efflux protein